MATATSGRIRARNPLGRARSTFVTLLPFYAANSLTLLRILAIPPLLYLLYRGEFALAAALFVVAAASDGVDGFIAKQFRSESRFGAMLDPMADKLLINSLYVLLALEGLLPIWLCVAVLARDLAILGGAAVAKLTRARRDVRPLIVGKLSTIMQFSLALAILLSLAGWTPGNTLVTLLVPAVAIVTAVSAVVYLAVMLTPRSSNA